jgi:hypothetical protein
LEKSDKEIKNQVLQWILELGSWRVITIEHPQFYFCFSIIHHDEAIIPITIAHLKELRNGVDCMVMGWEWLLNPNEKGVGQIMNNPSLRTEFVNELEQQLDPRDFRYIFNQNKDNFYSIGAQRIFPLSSLTKNLLEIEIANLIAFYTKMKYVFELVADI